MSQNKEEKSERPTPEEANRLWQHGMHEETILNNRLNFFLVLESVLLGIVAMLLGQSVVNPNRVLALRAFFVLGLALTIIWAYVAARQKYVFESLRKRLRTTLPEYAETVRVRNERRWPLSNLALLCYVVPEIIVLIWIALQFAV